MSGVDRFRLDAATVSRSIGSLPSIPAIVIDLLQSIDDPNASTEQLAHKIAGDQALVARLLRIANSSFYGLQRKVSSVQDAVFVLGMGNIRNLALAAALSNSFAGHAEASGINLAAFWRHGVATAQCAKGLARRMNCSGDRAFAAGLLHDIGRLVLASGFPKHYLEVSRVRAQRDCLFQEAEVEVLGIDHTVVGQHLAERWGFPEALCEAVGGHHDPNRLHSGSLAAVVHLADAIAHALDVAGEEAELVPAIYPPCWSEAGLSWADSQTLFHDVEGQLGAFAELFNHH